MPGGGLEPPRREALTPEASVSTNSTTAATQFVSVNEVLVPGGGLEPPRREALTPEASVSTNSTTAAQSVVDGVHVMRQVGNRQLSDANFQLFSPSLLKYSAKCWLLHQRPGSSTSQK